jgi:hypothetical protein
LSPWFLAGYGRIKTSIVEEEIEMFFRVSCNKYGYAVVEADTEDEAMEIAEEELWDTDFDWGDIGDFEILESSKEEI